MSQALRSSLTACLALADLHHGAEVAVGQLDRSTIDSVRCDLTGCTIDSIEPLKRLEAIGDSREALNAALPEGQGFSDDFHAVHANPGLVERAHVTAKPITLFGAATELEASLENVPITWLEDADGRIGVAPDTERTDAQLAGDLFLSVGQAALAEALQRVADLGLAEWGKGTKVDVQRIRFTQESAASVRVEGIAKVTKGFLGARATAAATISIENGTVVRVSDVQLASRNPIILAGLKVLEPRIQIDPIDLAEASIAGARVRQVSLEATDQLTLRATLG